MTDVRREVLDAAIQEFADVGLKDASVESIASRASVKPGAVRALFVDKDALLQEVLKEATEPMVSGVALAVQEIQDPREIILKSLQIYDQWLLDHRDLVRIIARCALNEPELLYTIYQSSMLPSEFYEHLEQVVDRGKLRCNDMFVLHLMLDSLILFPHMIRSAMELMNPEMTAEQTIKTRFDAVIDLFDNGLFESPLSR